MTRFCVPCALLITQLLKIFPSASTHLWNGCQSLCDLKMGENATYKSGYTADELLDACVKVIQTNISKKKSNSELTSIMTDESTYIVVKKKCVLYCIVVNQNLERQVMFLGNVEVEVSATAEVLFNHLKSYLVEKGVSVDKVVIKTANRIVGFYSIYNRVNEIR